jgi:hypothetical protein
MRKVWLALRLIFALAKEKVFAGAQAHLTAGYSRKEGKKRRSHFHYDENKMMRCSETFILLSTVVSGRDKNVRF